MANVDLVMRLLAEDRASDKFKKVGDTVGKTEGRFKTFGKVAAGAIAGIGVAAFAKQSIGKFAEMQDAQSALQATYGKTADAFIDFANNSADALNLSKREALQAAQSFANFGRAAGLSGKDLEKFTTPLIERAADAASYFGGTTSDAVEAFGAALRGEMEPIRRYGVLLDDATLRSKALEMGIIDSVKNALTPQQKALAAQALILEKTSQAQGDVARTSDSMANRIKDSQQQIDDFQTSVGETLSVALGPLLGGLNSGLQLFNALPQPIKSGAVAVGILGGAAVIAVPKIVAFKAALAQSEQMGGKFGKGMKGAAKSVGIFAAALAATAVLKSFSQANVDAAKNVDELGKSLDAVASGSGGTERLGRAFTTLTGRAVDFDEALGLVRDNHWWDQLDNGIGSLAGQQGNLGMATEAVAALDSALSSMVSDGHASDALAALANLGITADEAAQLLPGYTTAVKNAGESASGAVKPVDDLTLELDAQLTPIQKVVKGWVALDGILGRQDKRDAAVKAIKSLGKALEENGPVIRGDSDAALANRDAYRQAVGAVEAHLQSIGRGPGAIKAYDDEVGKLRDTLVKSKLSPKEIDALLKPITDMRAGIVGLTGLAKTPISLKIQPRIIGNGKIFIGSQGGKAVGEELNVTYRAGGGPVTAGKPYIVGERRPELFVPSQSGTILPRVPSMAGGGTANVNVYLDGRLVQTSLVDLKNAQGGRLNF